MNSITNNQRILQWACQTEIDPEATTYASIFACVDHIAPKCMYCEDKIVDKDDDEDNDDDEDADVDVYVGCEHCAETRHMFDVYKILNSAETYDISNYIKDCDKSADDDVWNEDWNYDWNEDDDEDWNEDDDEDWNEDEDDDEDDDINTPMYYLTEDNIQLWNESNGAIVQLCNGSNEDMWSFCLSILE